MSDMLPKVRTPWALTFVGRAFALNWDRGCEAGSLSSRSVKKGKVTNKPKEQMIPILQIKTHKQGIYGQGCTNIYYKTNVP